ncbi:MAG: hypothetical protein ABJH33_00135 [Rhizobiaceae bacterium]
MRMMIALIALAVRRMDRHIDGHAVAAALLGVDSGKGQDRITS